MVNIRISDTYSGCSRDFSSGSPDYPVFAFILILLCQRVRTLSPLVSWNEFIPNASGQLCEGTGHDAKDQTLHPAAGVSLPFRILIIFLILFKYTYFFTKIRTVREEDS